MTDKLCRICQKILPYSAFMVEKATGRPVSPCWDCRRARQRARYALLGPQRRDLERDREQRRARQKANPEARREGLRRWRARHPDLGKRQNNANRRVSRWRDLCAAIIDRDGGVCLCCGATAGLVIDHVVPVLQGGDDSWDNLQTLCRSCNSRKRGASDYRRRSA